ncbi:DNA repair helicase TFIIH P90 [Spironucleus salmonicida]|uniref:DNA 3'-5' helicase n=1 Tax=Spironucleus salmonicida TaxID=348837 RepID=V6LUH7_9EUKA|nr:DNA repair helicase TFIIH P90 [Spironucleus salmonicida]|eukprot:EST47361.1 DNA repair helicase [Spironucleus salmonicida]
MKKVQLSIDDLKKDHDMFPLTIFQSVKSQDRSQSKEFIILVETFNQHYADIIDFIVSIAEPQSRPQYIHEYIMSDRSLKAAVSLGISAEQVKETLLTHSKYRNLPVELTNLLSSGSDQVISIQIIDSMRYIVRLPRDFEERLKLLPQDKIKEIKTLFMSVTDDIDQVFDECHNDNSEDLITKQKTYKPIKQYVDIENITLFRKILNQYLANYYVVIEEAYIKQNFPVIAQFVPQKAIKWDIRDDYISYLQLQNKQHAEGVDPAIKTAFDAALELRDRNLPAALQATLKPTTVLRNYQQLSQTKVVSQINIKSKTQEPYLKLQSGMIVLPCGSGKSLQGISTACKIGASCIIVTNGNLSSQQWKSQFLQFTTIDEKRIFVFSTDVEDAFFGDKKREVFVPGYHTVLIATYNMLTNSSSKFSIVTKQLIHSNLWGIVLFDEAHGIFAKSFKTLFRTDDEKVGSNNFLKCFSKLMLTATPLREDTAFDDNLYLIGSKLFESNWSDLSKQGFIAKLNCAEVICPITRYFYKQYRNADTASGNIIAETNTFLKTKIDILKQQQDKSTMGSIKDFIGEFTTQKIKDQKIASNDIKSMLKTIIPILNPAKLRICSLLKNYHIAQQDQILIFCDNVIAGQTYARLLRIPFITGSCVESEREAIVSAFLERKIQCFLLSRVGDTSLDLPDANVLIEIDWQDNSRRQETQRIGRISRPKSSGQCGYFYILVSEQTKEVDSAMGRREYLSVNQGYSYSSITAQEIEETCTQNGIVVDSLVNKICTEKNNEEYFKEAVLLSTQRSEK